MSQAATPATGTTGTPRGTTPNGTTVDGADRITKSAVDFAARAEPSLDALRSPVSGQPCVHWRLRIVEHLTARSELVHELASSETFDLAWGGSAVDGRPPVRIRIDPEQTRIEATPTLHREGTPGALEVARAFGFAGALSVEEVLIRPGEEVEVAGTLHDARSGAGPFRSIQRLELVDATVRLASRNLGPALLLPWALGTAAALFGGLGLAGWAAWRANLLPIPMCGKVCSKIGLSGLPGSSGQLPSRLGPPEIPRPRLP